MATIYKCDQCHDEDKSPKFLRALELPGVTYYGRSYAEPEKPIYRELCAPCMAKVIRSTEPEPIVLQSPPQSLQAEISETEAMPDLPVADDDIHF